MSSTLRAMAVASCTAVLVAGAVATATAADAGGSPAFVIHPSFGRIGATVTLSGGTGFASTDPVTVTFNGVSASQVDVMSSSRLTAVVPAGATSGPVVVTETSATLIGPDFTVQRTTGGALSVSRSRLTFTQRLSVTGVLTARATGHGVAGQTAYLQHRVAGTHVWHHAGGTGAKRTGAHGRVRWQLTPTGGGAYRIHFAGSPAYAAATTQPRSVRVRPLLRLHRVRTVPIFSTSTLKGSIRPHLAGPVYLQRYVDGRWHRAATATAVHGRYSFTISPSSLGPARFRVYRRFDGRHARSLAPTLRLQVVNRDLVLGDSGPDVRALQKRLRALHYDIGPIDGSYLDDTLHAVTAFEKVQGLTPNGEVSMSVWTALNHPKRIHLRHPNAGTYEVEVNIGKQVLLLGKGSRVVRILDTSTAGGYLYTNSEGGTSRAITPTGHFNIQYKLTGTRVSKLGTLYYPSYFTNTGYAIHGEGNGNDGGEVPPFPNSHGCVRITDNAVLRYFSTPWLAVGASVWIYH